MKFKSIISILTLIGGAMLLSNCGDKPSTTPIVTPTDTTAPKPVNKFKAGFEIYYLDIDKDLTYGTYVKNTNQTEIEVSGVSSKNAVPGAVAGPGDFQIIFEGKGVGTYTQGSTYVNLEVGTDAGIKRNEYGTDDKSNVVIKVTEYGEVGGRIKGTFSGTLKTGINSILISEGVFDVERKPDI